MLNTGIKISEYPDGPIDNGTRPNRLVLDHFFISYAPSHYGIKYINKNFKVSLHALRLDFKGYIGINNSKGEYRNYIDVWSGYWTDKDRTNSYIYEWPENLKNHEDYIKDKFNKNGVKTLDKIFVLKSAPLPLEAEDTRFSTEEEKTLGKDPDPHSSKLVVKDYVDDRHNGFRKVDKDVDGAHLSIRPYTCYYQYSNLISEDSEGVRTIDICDDVIMEDGKTLHDKIKRNRLVFYVRIKNKKEYYVNKDGKHFNNLRFLVNGEKNKIKWSYENEFTEILRESRVREDSSGSQLNTSKDYIFIRFEAEYLKNENDEDIFTISATNFFGRGKHSKRMVEMAPDKYGEVPKIDLSLHENESFITQLNSAPQINITFDTSNLNDHHEYTWNYYIITPDQNYGESNYDNVIFENSGDIMWAMSETFNEAPRLSPNRLYCFEFIKTFDSVLIGRIKYYVNLVKKN